MGDVLLTDGGDLPVRPRTVSGAEITVQRIRAALALFEGEWLPDKNAGLPWLTWFRTTPFPESVARSTIRTELDGVQGVDEVRDLSLDFDPSNGVLTFDVEVIGSQTEEPIEVEFVVDFSAHEFHPIFTINQSI